MSSLSPLSSPECAILKSPHIPKLRRLTQDFQEEVTSTLDEKPHVDHFNSWTSFFNIFGDVPVRLDQEEFPDDPFNDVPSLPSSIPPVSPSSESYSSSPDSCRQCNETNTIPHDLMTPLNNGRVATGEALLGQTLELGNCTYELEQNNLTATVSKLNTTSNIFPDKSLQKHNFSISSTPLNTLKTDLPSDLTTYDAACLRSNNRIPHMNLVNELFKSPIHPSRPYLAIKPADSTVDIENENELDLSVSPKEPLTTEKRPSPTRRESTKIPLAHKPPSKLVKSTIPVMPRPGNRLAGTSNKPLRGLRLASSTNSLVQIPRTSLLPTSLKSRSHDRINAPAATRGFNFKK